MSFVLFRGRQVLAVVLSVVLTTLVVALVVQGTTYVDTDSVGIATDTPGGALGVKGDAFIEGFLVTDYIRATSTGFSSGFGTTSPGAEFAVASNALFSGLVSVGSLKATSTENSIFNGAIDVREAATSSFVGGATIATTTIIDNVTGRVGIGTTTLPDAEIVAGTFAVDPALTVSGAGGAINATGTVYITGGGANGGQIILKGSNGLGSRCVSLIVNTGATDVGGSGAGVAELLIAKVVACPE